MERLKKANKLINYYQINVFSTFTILFFYSILLSNGTCATHCLFFQFPLFLTPGKYYTGEGSTSFKKLEKPV